MRDRRPRRVSGPGPSSLPAALVCACLIASSLGCVTAGLVETTVAYYDAGPKEALEVLEHEAVRRQDAVLAGMERAVALQELGDYESSNESLLQCTRAIEAAAIGPGEGVARVLAGDQAGVYRGEHFEQVYLHTLAAANYLAMQQVAEADAELALARDLIDSHSCPACRFTFTRYLSALCREHRGAFQEALDLVAECLVETSGVSFLEREAERLAARVDGLPGLAPPPVERRGERTLYLLLLLGHGPEKVEGALPLPPSHAVTWPRYVPRMSGMTGGAVLTVEDHGTYEAVLLTDVLELARASLHSRLTSLVAGEVGGAVAKEVVIREVGEDRGFGAELLARFLFSLGDRADLRHWSSLPDSCLVLRAPVPTGVARCTLTYTDAWGDQVDTEILPIPEWWTRGPLFITRRMP